jgi:methylated-DNA-[protein]-cysteine S-methyltransferase
MHTYSTIDTGLGKFRLASSPRGITAISPATESRAQFEAAYRKRFGTDAVSGDIPESYRKALELAASGRSFPPVAVDWSHFTEFQRKVLKELTKVPRGKVQTYSWLARRAGNPKAARAVGNAMARNPVPFIIPCHRIVPESGGVGNYGLGKSMKRKLLLLEGAVME